MAPVVGFTSSFRPGVGVFPFLPQPYFSPLQVTSQQPGTGDTTRLCIRWDPIEAGRLIPQVSLGGKPPASVLVLSPYRKIFIRGVISPFAPIVNITINIDLTWPITTSYAFFSPYVARTTPVFGQSWKQVSSAWKICDESFKMSKKSFSFE